MSDSYAIGKRGIKLLQGTADPTGVAAPTGSLYILRGETTNRVFQIDSGGIWTALLSPDDIIAGDGISVSMANGQVTITAETSKYQRTFTSGNLSNGVLVVTHNLGEDFPLVQIYDNNRTAILPDSVVTYNANIVALDFTSYGNIAGNWTATVISN